MCDAGRAAGIEMWKKKWGKVKNAHPTEIRCTGVVIHCTDGLGRDMVLYPNPGGDAPIRMTLKDYLRQKQAGLLEH